MAARYQPAAVQPGAVAALVAQEAAAALAAVLPGLAELEIRFEDSPGGAQAERPEDRLRQEAGFQDLLRLSGGEVLEIRREG